MNNIYIYISFTKLKNYVFIEKILICYNFEKEIFFMKKNKNKILKIKYFKYLIF